MTEWILPWIKANPVALVLALVLPVLVHFVLRSLFVKRKTCFLNPQDFQPLRLSQKKYLTHNTVFLRFDLPEPSQRLGLPIGQHIVFKASDAEGKDFFRPYTPVSLDHQLGSVDFVIKTYPTGKMSQVVSKMQVGDKLPMKGPKGRFHYEPNMKTHIGMIAGGSGITPMYQVTQAILRDPKDKTCISLVFANVAEEDILLRDELDALSRTHPTRFKLFYVLNKPPVVWDGGVGFVSSDMLEKQLPKAGKGVMILRCGPPPMNDAVKKILDSLGYNEEDQFQF